MAKHVTRKSSAAGKSLTLERRSMRRSKRSEKPLNTSALMAEFKAAEDCPEAVLARLQSAYGIPTR